MTVILVCGSRKWNDYQAIEDRLANVPVNTTIIHGDCPTGADAMADRAALKLGLNVLRFPADWERYSEMLSFFPIDLVLAFPKPKSSNTWNTVNKARKLGILVELPDGSYVVGNKRWWEPCSQ